MIRSLYDNQDEILQAILELNGVERFDADCTYGNGSFYKTIPEPRYKFDIDRSLEGVRQACSTELPLADGTIGSLVFDPPFLTYVRDKRKGNGNMVMARRFSGYWRYEELRDHYMRTILEAYRVLKPQGILVFKCQDLIHNHKMHCTHVNVINWASPMFRLKDLFVLAAKHRMPIGDKKRGQNHARIYHSYFLVLERER